MTRRRSIDSDILVRSLLDLDPGDLRNKHIPILLG